MREAISEVLRQPARWDTLYLEGGKLVLQPSGPVRGLPRVFQGYDASGHRIGVAVLAAEPGFTEIVSLIFGFDPESGRLLGMKVLEQKETPGLGDKIEKDTGFVSQFARAVVPLKGVKRADRQRPSGSGCHHRRDHLVARRHPHHQQCRRALASAPARVSARDDAMSTAIRPPDAAGRSAAPAVGAPVASVVMRKPEPPLFGDFMRGVWKENPILVQMLGMCPTMAVTNNVLNGIAMGVATTFVLLGSEFIVSLFRRRFPNEVRIASYILIIATFVTLADLILEALTPDVHKALGAFIALIVANCLLLGRQEAFAARQPVHRAVLDALGTGLGFTLGLSMIGTIRELLGNGTFLGLRVLPATWEPWVIMVLPPGGFLTLGIVLLIAVGVARDAGAPNRRSAEPEDA